MAAYYWLSLIAYADWNQFQLAPPNSASGSTLIKAVSRVPKAMEVWWIAPDGSVQDANWYDGWTFTTE
jgi:hypothetical protein